MVQKYTTSETVNINSSTALTSQQRLLFELIPTDVWTNLLEKFKLRESKWIWTTQLADLNDYQLVLRCQDGLRIFQYIEEDHNWQQILHSEDFCDQNGFSKSCYPIQFWKISQLNKDILICRLESGYYFVEYDTSTRKLQGLAQDMLFSDAHRWYDEHNNLQWGSFYGLKMPPGLFTQHIEQGIRFYITNLNGFVGNDQPLWEDNNTNEYIQSIWQVKDDHFEFADITGTGMTNIIRQNDQGLSIYCFQITNDEFTLTELIKTDLCNKSSRWLPKRDKLWFVRLTESPFYNLVLLQSDGLKVYEYVDKQQGFVCLHHDRTMTERLGWNKQHTDSIIFADINDNGFMQLIYTGPYGLTIRSFNPIIHQWECNLNPNEINFENRYANAVMFIPANKSPTHTLILITKYNDKLNCFTIKKNIVQMDLSSESNLILSSPNEEMKISKSSLIPSQTEYINRAKSVIFLRDTLDIKPLLSAVNIKTGKLDITLPLVSVNTGSNNLQMHLALRYQGINQHATILGIGWNLVEDYIAIDYRMSIDPSSHRYYWITSHGSIALITRRPPMGGVRHFRLATSYDLFLIKSLNVNNLPDIQDNAIILVGPDDNNNYYAYHVQNNQWLRNPDDNQFKKILMKKMEMINFEPSRSNGLIEINDKNFENIVKIVRIVTSNENYFDMNIIYDSNKQYWQMKTSEGKKRLYGNVQTQLDTSDSIAWTIGWDNWMGRGNDTKYQKRYPIRWHLKEVQGYQADKIIYTYENRQCQVDNTSFTQSIYLKSISDNNNNNRINLNYEKKSVEEYQEPVLKDSDGNLQLSPIFDIYLKTIEIITRVNIQKIEFKYEIHNQIRQLITLSQTEDIYLEPILKFSYKNFDNFIEIDQIQLPNGEQLSFTYNLNKIEYMKRCLDVYSGEYFVQEQPELTMGSDYMILSEINEKIFNFRILQSKQAPCVNSIRFLEIETYRTFARKDYFGFILKTMNNTFTLFLYHQYLRGEWCFEPKQYSISSFTIQWIDNSLVFVNSQQQIIVTDWNINQETWQENVLSRPSNVSQNSELLLKTNQSQIIVYDDQHLWIIYRDYDKNWQTKLLKFIPNYFSQSKQTLEKFEITSTLFEDIFQYLKLQTLQCYNNIICLSSWHEENGKFKSIQSIFMLNSNDNIQFEKTDFITQEESYEVIFSKPQERIISDDTLTFRFMYQYLNDKFRVVFEPQVIKKKVEIKGKKYRRIYELKDQNITISLRGIKSCVAYNKHTGESFTEMDEDQNIQSGTQCLTESFKNIFFIDLTKCLPQLNINQILSGNKKWVFNGNQWQETIMNENKDQIMNKYLDRDYVLHKTNLNDSLKLYKQNTNGQIVGDCLYDFEVTSLENISIGYPNYIAFKQNDNRISILPIHKKKLGEVYYLPDGNFTPWNNSQVLIIAQPNSKDKTRQKLIIYPNPGQSDLHHDPVVVKTCLDIGNEKRLTGYQYYEESAILINDCIVYNNTDTIPGADKSRHGWIENTSEVEHVQRRYFNSKQEEISTPIPTKKSKDDEKSESLSDSKTTIFLSNTNFEIARFHNSNIQNDEGAYLSFEPYETENSSAWQFQRENLIQNNWSLTGTSYLRLHNTNDSLRRIFKPKNQNCSYQAACWLRSTNKNFPSKNAFQAIIKTNKNDIIGTLSSNLLRSRNEWYYFEININLPEIKSRGALKPIYSVEFNSKRCLFQEDDDFTSLDISRKLLTEQLLTNVHNIEIRSLVAPEIQIAFLQDTLPDIMKRKSSYQNLHKKYEQYQEKMDQDVRQINTTLGLKDNHRLDLKNLIEYVGKESKYEKYYQQLNQLQKIANEIKTECENYSKLEETFKDFIEYGHLHCLIDFNGEQIKSSIFDFITQLNKIRFYLWKPNSNNELILLHTNQDKIIEPQQTIHLLYTSNITQFQKLIDVTNSCLSKDKCESLKQGHEYLLIDLIIQPTNDYSLDIDHIRFSSRDEKFYARIYDPETYQVTALLDGNGTMKYMFYNRQYQPLAVTDWKKYLKELSIYGRHGNVLSFGSKLARKQPRSEIQIKPMHGFYEDFSKMAFEKRWLIETINCWKRLPGCLIHTGQSNDNLILQNDWLDGYSGGIQVELNLLFSAKIEIKIHHHLIIVECLNSNETSLIINDEYICSIPSYAEYLIISEGDRLFVWVNGQLQFDKELKIHMKNSNCLSFNLIGHISLNQLFVFSEPKIDVTYKNILDEELQTIHLENFQSAIVTQTLYDDLGRQSIITKPTRIIVHDHKPLLAFQHDFIQKLSQTGQLIGTANDFNLDDEGYCYFQIQYADNPLNQKIISGQPGRLFTVNEIGSLKYTHNTQSNFINLLFPREKGYSVQVCIQPHGTEQITVLDSNENRVALYVHTNTGNNLLTTYEYDDENRLRKILSPVYHAHKEINTLGQTIPYTQLMQQWQNNEQFQKKFSIRMAFNKHGKVIERITPDVSKQILIYSQENLLRFILQHDLNDKPYRVIYYQYDPWGDLSSQGYSTECLNQEVLQNLANNYRELPKAITYLQILKMNSSPNANFRHKSITSVIKHFEGTWQESSTYTHEGKLSSKEIIIMNSNLWQIYSLDFTYIGDHVTRITYPMLFKNQPLIITYTYDKQKHITAIGTPNNNEQWMKFTYAGHGQMSDEIHIANNFLTHYDYNSPGYLKTIENKYFQEIINYTEGSYGQGGFFDGTIAQTQFSALWFDNCNTRLLSLDPEKFREYFQAAGENITLKQAEYYLQILVNTGFLNEHHRLIKEFLPQDTVLNFPSQCGGDFAYLLAELLNQYFPQMYGHHYSYGNHMELIKAKYFVGNKILKPIQPLSFTEEIDEINLEQSKLIWEVLVKNAYIHPDNDDGIHIQGKISAEKWIDYKGLNNDLGKYADYDHLIATVLQKYFSQRKILTKEIFEKIFQTWVQVDIDTQKRTSEIRAEAAKEIWTILFNKNYLYSTNSSCLLLKKEFYEILQNYRKFIPEIVNVLQEYSSYQMGQSPSDVEAYLIDKNGNHRHYWTGYARYQLHYKENNNQTESIDYSKITSRDKLKTNFKIVHDALGNITKAEHKGIVDISYDPTTNRPKRIQLQDGRQVYYDYDTQGERVRKCINNKNGEKLKEIIYLRDDEGRSLVEKVVDFIDGERFEQQTGYIYGSKGIIGFIRNDEFYSVICDHEGSIRLIVKDQEIIAAYDYLPYGSLMRQYGMTQVQIPYRYTGQEWDEETGLYNYHARLYDPDIGRFYQIDPQEQYASPYKYAGNSPVSMIDPSGEIAFLPIGLGLFGAYLGGSAANNSWSPLEWDLMKINTYVGIGVGALTGIFAPIGFASSIDTLTAFGLSFAGAVTTASTIGFTIMYLSMGSANNSWNPTEWQWSRPMTWNVGFQGFTFGFGAINGIAAWGQYYTRLESVGKVALSVSSGALALGMSYLSCATANASFNPKQWKLSPGTIYAGLGGAFGGWMAPVGVRSTWLTICSFETTTTRLLMGFTTIGSGLFTSYVFVSLANNSFSWSNWDMSSPKTYTAIIGGILFGISLPGLPRVFRDGMKRTSETWKRREYCQQKDQKVDPQSANETGSGDSKVHPPSANETGSGDSKVHPPSANETGSGDSKVDPPSTNETGSGDPPIDQQSTNETGSGDPPIDQQSTNETGSGDPPIDQQSTNETVQGNYEIDQQLADEIVDTVNNFVPKEKLSENGVIAIGAMKDGTKIFAYSGGTKNAFIAGIVGKDGGKMIWFGEATNPDVKIDELVLYRHITDNLGCTIDYVQTEGGMPNEHGSSSPRNPATCAEPRVMIIGFALGYTKDDFVSITPFRREPLGVASVPPCGNCQVTLDIIFPQ